MQEEHPRLSYNRLSGQVEPIPELSETPVKTELAEQTDEPEKRVSIPRVSFNRKLSETPVSKPADKIDELEKRVSIPRVSFNQKSSQVEPIPELSETPVNKDPS